jgi:hypothetical protein
VQDASGLFSSKNVGSKQLAIRFYQAYQPGAQGADLVLWRRVPSSLCDNESLLLDIIKALRNADIILQVFQLSAHVCMVRRPNAVIPKSRLDLPCHSCHSKKQIPVGRPDRQPGT